MSDGPPTPFNPSPSDHMNFAPQTRKYRADRSIRALGMQGISTGGIGRPLYGLGQITEDVITAARGSSRPNNRVENLVDNRPKLAAGQDGSVALLRENLPAKPIKQPNQQRPATTQTAPGWPGVAPMA